MRAQVAPEMHACITARQSFPMIGLGHGTPKFSRNLRLYRRSHRRFRQPKNL